MSQPYGRRMMSTRRHMTHRAGPPALEIAGPVTRVPSLEELERLTAIPDRRVVYRGVDWAFYDRLVDSIPESSNIHVDYDGKDLEVMGKRRRHERSLRRLRKLVEVVAEESGIDYSGGGTTTWKRPELARGLEADECYYFLPEKIAADAAALERGSDDIADYPNPDLAIEVDLSPPQVDRAGIYAALRVAEVWRFDGRTVVIDRLTADGTYKTRRREPLHSHPNRGSPALAGRRSPGQRGGLGDAAACGDPGTKGEHVGQAFQPDVFEKCRHDFMRSIKVRLAGSTSGGVHCRLSLRESTLFRGAKGDNGPRARCQSGEPRPARVSGLTPPQPPFGHPLPVGARGKEPGPFRTPRPKRPLIALAPPGSPCRAMSPVKRDMVRAHTNHIALQERDAWPGRTAWRTTRC